MPILDMSKIDRPEIVELLEQIQKLRDEAAAEFFSQPENQGIDFPALWERVMDGNARWFRGENVSGLITPEEQLFIARQHRFSVEYRSNALQATTPAFKEGEILDVVAGGVPAEWQTIAGADLDRVSLYFHGGGYIMGTPNFLRPVTSKLARKTGMRILSVDYRLAPEHPFPAAVEDCLASYRWLLAEGVDPAKIVIAGDSAGGYFTLQTLVRARNEGLPAPACAVCLSPATDLAASLPTNRTNAPTDPVLADIGIFWWLEAHLAGADPTHPGVSPLYADLEGLPPILMHASSSEMLLDDAAEFVERARAAGVNATLQTWPETVHVFHYFDLPEAEEGLEEIRKFIAQFAT
jgi:acetyl esterase/lipase